MKSAVLDVVCQLGYLSWTVQVGTKAAVMEWVVANVHGSSTLDISQHYYMYVISHI